MNEWMEFVNEEEVYPTKTEPTHVSTMEQMMLPHGTQVQSDEEFWGTNRGINLEKRSLAPDYLFADHEWTMNPRECGLQNSYINETVYCQNNDLNLDSLGWSNGEYSDRSVDVKEQSLNRYGSFTSRNTATHYGAEPFRANGMGGMGPQFSKHLGNSGHYKPSVPAYIAPAGTTSGHGPMMPNVWLPSTTRTDRTWSSEPGVDGGYVSAHGYMDETLNDVTMGLRPRINAGVYGGNDVIPTGPNGGGVMGGQEYNPQIGGRMRQQSNFIKVGGSGISTGLSGIGVSNITGGRHWTKTSGVPGRAGNCGRSGVYNSDPKIEIHAKERGGMGLISSIMYAGSEGRGGSIIPPEYFPVIGKDTFNFDNTPEEELQKSARSMYAANNLLDFSSENLNDLSFNKI
jgi:hypothetical protein